MYYLVNQQIYFENRLFWTLLIQRVIWPGLYKTF